MLLGVLWGGGHYKATGEFVIKEIPSRYDTTVVTSIPNNLGIVVKAAQLKELDDLFKERYP